MLAEVIAGVVWLLLLQPRRRHRRLLDAVGLGGLVQGWLATPEYVLWTLSSS